MTNVTVRVLARDLAREMVLMREWLDLNRCEPIRFDCGKNGAEVVLFVAFGSGLAAEGFARRFSSESGASASIQG
jgi:hypothetical protein